MAVNFETFMTTQKDYYHILKVSSKANADEIKKAYRKLALLFHPDRNPNNKLAEQEFAEIAEAYRILSDVTKKHSYDHQYHYKSTTATGNPFHPTVRTALQQCITLRNNLAVTNPYQLDYDVLFYLINDLSNKTHITLFEASNDSNAVHAFVENYLFCCQFIPIGYSQTLCKKLEPMLAKHPTQVPAIEKFLKEKRIDYLLERYEGLIVFGITISILIIAVWLGKRD
jgi:molecular chaperone DnaJ